MLPVVELHEGWNLIDADPVDLPVCFSKGGKFLLALVFRLDIGMALETLGSIGHTHHLPGIPVGVTGFTCLL
jgi:hypothetical protein